MKKIFAYSAASVIVGFGSCGAFAQDAGFDVDDQGGGERKIRPVLVNEIEIGGQYISRDVARYSRYNGLGRDMIGSHGVGIGNIILMDRGDKDDPMATNYFEMRGTDLGTDNRSMDVRLGHQGTWGVFLNYDQLLYNEYQNARTLFNGAGTNNLVLPGGWVYSTNPSGMTKLNANLKEVDLNTQREAMSGGVKWHFYPGWEFKSSFKRDVKTGLQMGSYGSNGSTDHAVFIPYPVNFETNNAIAEVGFNSGPLQVSLSYSLSLFDDKTDKIQIEDPMTNTVQRAQLGTPPDNQAHLFKLAAGYNLTPSTRLNADLQYNLMMQDEAFLPYTINPGVATVASLPRNSPDAKIETKLLNLGVSSQIDPQINLRASYRFYDRHNDTPQSWFNYVQGDSSNSATTLNSSAYRLNMPYSQTQHLGKIDLGFKLTRNDRLDIGASAEYKERTLTFTDYTTETGGRAKYTHNFGIASVAMGYAYSNRQAHDYDWTKIGLSYTDQYMSATSPNRYTPGANSLINPALRAFDQASRDRNEYSLSVTGTPNSGTTLGMMTKLAVDNYGETRLGLRDGKRFSGTLDGSQNFAKGVDGHAFYTYEYNLFDQWEGANSRYYQWGSTFGEQTINRNHTVGGNIEWLTMEDKLKLTLGGSVTKDMTDIRYFKGAEAVGDFWEFMYSIGGGAEYSIDDNMSIRGFYNYSRLVSHDYQWDGNVGIAPDSFGAGTSAALVPAGVGTPDYAIHTVGLSFKYKF